MWIQAIIDHRSATVAISLTGYHLTYDGLTPKNKSLYMNYLENDFKQDREFVEIRDSS